MTLYDRRRNKLINALKNKEYRDAYVEESIRVNIPFQIKTLRNQRKWKQEDLEKHSGIKQSRISLLEDPNYPGFSMATLKKLASGFDVGLVVRFVPFSDLVKWELNLSSESLGAIGFNKDPYFKGKEKQEISKSDTNQHEVVPLRAAGKVIDITHRLKTDSSIPENKMPVQKVTGRILAA